MFTEAPETASISNMAAGRSRTVPCYWIPSQTPQAKKTMMAKPVGRLLSSTFVCV